MAKNKKGKGKNQAKEAKAAPPKTQLEENFEFWDNLNTQEYEDFDQKRTIPVYLLTDFCDDDEYTLYVLGARAGDELSKQIAEGPESVKCMPSADWYEVCMSTKSYYGSFKSPTEEGSEDPTAREAIIHLLGLGIKEPHGDDIQPAYRGLLWQQQPPSGRTPTLELSSLAVCVRPRGEMLIEKNTQRFWVSSLKRLGPNESSVAYAILSGENFEEWSLEEGEDAEDMEMQ